MALIIYTDPHIGVNRTGNTTPASRELLREKILKGVYGILARKNEGDYAICLGDLFDTYSNPESVIRQGMSIVGMTDLTLAGNHDVVADADKVGSLQLITNNYSHKVVYARFNEPWAETLLVSNTIVTAVPHVTTQDLFEESLDKAVQQTLGVKSHTWPKILLLHCNYDSPHELTETSLNLTPQRVEELLDTYNYIFCGHEHQPRDLFDGRLIILGNTHPTSFADISSKRIAVLDEGGVVFHPVWDMDADAGYVEWNINTDVTLDSTEAQFVRIKGEVPSDQMAEVSKAVSRLWKNSPNLLALRSEVRVTGMQQQDTSGVEVTAETLPALVERELASDPAMQAMWQEFTS